MTTAAVKMSLGATFNQLNYFYDTRYFPSITHFLGEEGSEIVELKFDWFTIDNDLTTFLCEVESCYLKQVIREKAM